MREIEQLKMVRNIKHNRASLRWRDQAFYYKKKAKALEQWIKDKGFTLPRIEELLLKREDSDELRVCSTDTKKSKSSPPIVENDKKLKFSDDNSGQGIPSTSS